MTNKAISKIGKYALKKLAIKLLIKQYKKSANHMND